MFAATRCLIILPDANFVGVKGSCCNIVVGGSSFMTSGSQLWISALDLSFRNSPSDFHCPSHSCRFCNHLHLSIPLIPTEYTIPRVVTISCTEHSLTDAFSSSTFSVGSAVTIQCSGNRYPQSTNTYSQMLTYVKHTHSDLNS